LIKKVVRRSGHHLLNSHSGFNKILSGLVAALVVSVGVYVITVSHAAVQSVYLSPASGTILNGNTVAVAIRTNSGADGVNAAQVNLAFNPAQLQYVSVDNPPTGAYGTQYSATGDNTAGTVQIIRLVTQPSGAPAVSITGDQLFATVTFRAVAGSSSAAITIANGTALVRSSDQANLYSSATAGNAAFSLTSPATPTPTPVKTPTPTPTPIKTPVPTATPIPTATPTPAPGSATVSISPTSATATVGDTVSLALKENSGSTAVNAVQINYTYDTSKFSFIGFDGNASGFSIDANSTGTNGQIKLGRASVTPVTGTQTIATIKLKAIGSGGTTSVVGASGSAIVKVSGPANILSGALPTATVVISVAGGGGGIIVPTPTPPVTVVVSGGTTTSPVAGKVTLVTPAPHNATTTFKVDGTPVPGNTLNTASLDDGTHTITATVQDPNGSTTTTTQKITVNNHESLGHRLIADASKAALPITVIVLIGLVFGGLYILSHYYLIHLPNSLSHAFSGGPDGFSITPAHSSSDYVASAPPSTDPSQPFGGYDTSSIPTQPQVPTPPPSVMPGIVYPEKPANVNSPSDPTPPTA
jgi:hypothetical protein